MCEHAVLVTCSASCLATSVCMVLHVSAALVKQSARAAAGQLHVAAEVSQLGCKLRLGELS